MLRARRCNSFPSRNFIGPSKASVLDPHPGELFSWEELQAMQKQGEGGEGNVAKSCKIQ